MKKTLDMLYLSAAPFLARQIIRLLAATMRLKYVNFEWYRKYLAGGGQIILAFWHGRLLMMPYSYPGKGITILVSASRDGELIARTVKGFGIDSVRGSSTRGRIGAMKGLLQSIKNGHDAAITPDGPRGPGMKAQMGVIQIARATGLPIVPIAFNASKKKRFRSWDSFIMPYPFTRGVFICGEPIHVDAGADGGRMEEARMALEKALNELTARADGFFSKGPARWEAAARS